LNKTVPLKSTSYVGLRIFSCKLNIYHKFLGKLDNTQYESNTIKNLMIPLTIILDHKSFRIFMNFFIIIITIIIILLLTGISLLHS